MKISFIIPDLSDETFHRLKALYNMLKDNFEIEIIAVDTKKSKNKLFTEYFQNLKKIKYDLGTIIKDLKKNVTGDIIYAIKAKPTSFGFAMSLKSIKKIPVILDISANETYNCFPYTNNPLKGILSSILIFKDTNSYTYTKILEKRIKLADEITISSNLLQKKYGGTLITSSPNENIFNPEIYKINEIRESMNWTNKKVILFAGKYNRDTDINYLIETVEKIDRNDLLLCIIGDNKKIKESDKVNFISYQPEENIAKLLSACDLVVVPQKDIYSSFGKIPIKIYESILSNKPLVLPDLYDFKELFPEAIFYDTKDNNSLSKIILLALDAKNENRNQFLEKYNFDKMSKKLTEFIKTKF